MHALKGFVKNILENKKVEHDKNATAKRQNQYFLYHFPWSLKMKFDSWSLITWLESSSIGYDMKQSSRLNNETKR